MIHVGDCLEVMRTLDANSVDSIVTDPPYHLTTGKKGGTGRASVNLNSPAGRARITAGFMGKAWDGGDVAFRPETWAEALRVAKPGAYLAAFGGTRTFHRLACAIEDAGWELRDCVPYAHEGVWLEPVADCPWLLAWVYGSGFPKSHNGEWGGTALKPAWEPIVLARKPLAGTVEANWREHGTGALNIDGCRIVSPDGNPSIERRQGSTRHLSTRSAAETEAAGKMESRQSPEAYSRPRPGDELGRWPANLVHDGSDVVVAPFPREAGASAPVRGTEPSASTRNTYGTFERAGGAFHGDAGSAARFFYCAKASREDRNDGCQGMPERPLLWSSGAQSPGTFQAEGTRRASENNHPTVKPTDLMRWLCRLVTPPGGVVLDPFAGSGSTGRGAIAEGMRFVGIERDPDYASIAMARIHAMQPGLALAVSA